MGKKYTKVEELTAAIRARKAAEETKRTIGKSYSLNKSSLNNSLNAKTGKSECRWNCREIFHQKPKGDEVEVSSD